MLGTARMEMNESVAIAARGRATYLGAIAMEDASKETSNDREALV